MREVRADWKQRSAHENPVIFYSLAIGFVGELSCSAPRLRRRLYYSNCDAGGKTVLMRRTHHGRHCPSDPQVHGLEARGEDTYYLPS